MNNTTLTHNDLSKAYELAFQVSTRPDPDKFPIYKEGDIIDENESVKWNREEVERRRDARNGEIKRLRKIANEKAWEFADYTKLYIKQNSSANDNQASIIYSKAWADGHSGGFEEFYNYLDDYLDFFNDLEEAGQDK